MSEEGEKIRRMQRYERAIQALAAEGDVEAARLVNDRTSTGNVRRHQFRRGTMLGVETLYPALSDRVRARVVMERLES